MREIQHGASLHICIFQGGKNQAIDGTSGVKKKSKESSHVSFIFKEWANKSADTVTLRSRYNPRKRSKHEEIFFNHWSEFFSWVLRNKHVAVFFSLRSVQGRQWFPPMPLVVRLVYKFPELVDEIVTASQEHLRQDFSVLSHNMPGGNGLHVVWGDNRCLQFAP